MMRIPILNSARFLKDDLVEIGKRGDLRKATRNMLMAYTVVEKILKPFSLLIAEFKSNIGVVLGTGHGELETTMEFLKCYRQQGVARPILFQNSLHNSTLGFLSQAFSFTGPAITNSDLFFTGEKSLETATLLLKEKLALFCLVIGIDALVSNIEEPFRLIYPRHIKPGEGCGAVLLSSMEGVERLQLDRPKAWLHKVSCEQGVGGNQGIELDSYYDSDAIEKFVLELENPNSTGKLSLQKPDGSRSCIEFTRA